MTLTKQEKALHARAVRLAKFHERAEWKLVLVLQEVYLSELNKKLSKKNLFIYGTDLLGLTPSQAYTFSAVARKALEIPELQLALKARELSICKASRIVSVASVELVEFAKTHTQNEIDREVARRQVGRKKRAVLKRSRLSVTLTPEAQENLKRARSIQAQRGLPDDIDQVLAEALEVYLDRYDPVRKAERAEKRKSAKSMARTVACVDEIVSSKVQDSEDSAAKVSARADGRVPLTAAEKHVVFSRSQGCCEHIDENGVRCREDRWVEVHHKVPVSHGGSSDPSNLALLCGFHHDLVHQLGFDIDGQTIWTANWQGAAPYRPVKANGYI